MEKIIFLIFNVAIILTVLYIESKYSHNIQYISICCKSEYRESIKKDQPDFYCLTCKKWCELEVEKGR